MRTPFEEEKILKAHTKKHMVKTYRKMLTVIANLSLKNITVNVHIAFGLDGVSCGVTIFNKQADNRSLTMYDFNSIKQIDALYKDTIAIIKKDNFEDVVKASGY